MNLKKYHLLKLPITLFTITFIGIVFLVVLGIKLTSTELITFGNNGPTEVTIRKDQEYFVLLDTHGVREEISIENDLFSNDAIITDEENDPTYKNTVLVTSDFDSSNPTITQIEFDEQIKTRGYLSIGTITLKEGTYSIETVNQIANEAYGDYALLGSNYVNIVGIFSFIAIATFTMALLGFKSYITYMKKPLTANKQKHVHNK